MERKDDGNFLMNSFHKHYECCVSDTGYNMWARIIWVRIPSQNIYFFSIAGFMFGEL
jgi:hypothetical protein